MHYLYTKLNFMGNSDYHPQSWFLSPHTSSFTFLLTLAKLHLVYEKHLLTLCKTIHVTL